MALALLWLGGALLSQRIPQRPDGDLTAISLFVAAHGDSSWHTLRNAWWLNGAGAALIAALLATLLRQTERWGGRELLTLAVLLGLSGWLWQQTRGWDGTLYLEPDQPVALGVDGRPTVTFEGFSLPPAASGEGRALSMRLTVEEQNVSMADGTPLRFEGWTLEPRWFGATVEAPELPSPLFFGESGSRRVALTDGRTVELTVDIETLAVESMPPLDRIATHHHAIVAARFVPAAWLQWLALLLGAAGALAWLWETQRKGKA